MEELKIKIWCMEPASIYRSDKQEIALAYIRLVKIKQADMT